MIRTMRKAAAAAVLMAAFSAAGVISAYAYQDGQDPSAMPVSIPVKVKEVSANSYSVPDATFTLKIEAKTDGAPAALNQEVDVALTKDEPEKQVNFTFADDAFQKPGIYEYKITQYVKDENKNSRITYDTTEYGVTVEAINRDPDHIDGTLVYYVVGKAGTAEYKPDCFEFSNTYTYKKTGGGGGGGGGSSSPRGGSTTGGPGVTTTTEVTTPEPLTPVEVITGMLPQTGQLNWPVPFLAAGGLLLLVCGCRMTFGKARRDA